MDDALKQEFWSYVFDVAYSIGALYALVQLCAIMILFIEWPKIQKIERLRAQPMVILSYASIYWLYYRIKLSLNKAVPYLYELPITKLNKLDTNTYEIQFDVVLYAMQAIICILVAALASVFIGGLIMYGVYHPNFVIIMPTLVLSFLFLYWLFNWRFNRKIQKD